MGRKGKHKWASEMEFDRGVIGADRLLCWFSGRASIANANMARDELTLNKSRNKETRPFIEASTLFIVLFRLENTSEGCLVRGLVRPSEPIRTTKSKSLAGKIRTVSSYGHLAATV